MSLFLVLELQEQNNGILWWRSPGDKKPTCNIENAMQRQWNEIEPHAFLLDNATRTMAVPVEVARRHTRQFVPVFASPKAMHEFGDRVQAAIAAINGKTAVPEPAYVMRMEPSMSPLFMVLLSSNCEGYEVELESAGEFSIADAAKSCAISNARRHRSGKKAAETSGADIVVPKSVAAQSAIRAVPNSRNIIRTLRDESVLYRQTLNSF